MARKRKAPETNAASESAPEPAPLRWMKPTDRRLTVKGLAWFEENEGRFMRLPARAEGKVRPDVWELGRSPASANLAFRTDATSISVRATNSDAVMMPHMPATGSSGLALYCGEPYRMRPWATVVPATDSPSFEQALLADLPQQMREYRLYLPLYKPLESLEIGFNQGARILRPSAPAVEKPAIFYGTSITQGGCANTAGTDYVATVGRLLNLDVINLGFSGNGKGDPEIAELMAEIDASLYVLDYVANVDEATLRRTLPRFVRILREKHPTTPILLMTIMCFGRYFQDGMRQGLEARRDIMMEFYINRRKAGDTNIHLADGFGLLQFGVDGAFVDGVHPTDHGFMLMAEQIAPYIEQILLRDPACS